MSSQQRQSDAVRATFDSAADHYDHPSQAHWQFTADRSLEVASLRRGERVLDVCCGSGSTAIPAAEQVGPDGTVLGVDLSDAMLELARAKRRAAALDNLHFERGDLLALGHLAEPPFDVVLCQLGIFFLDEPAEGVDALYARVRPGGRLVVTTFLGPPLAPATAFLRAAIADESGSAEATGGPSAVRPSATGSAEGMRGLAEAAGAEQIEIRTFEHEVELARPEDYWPMALGGGARGLIDRLSEDARTRVRTRVIEQLRANAVDRLRWNLLVTVARK